MVRSLVAVLAAVAGWWAFGLVGGSDDVVATAPLPRASRVVVPPLDGRVGDLARPRLTVTPGPAAVVAPIAAAQPASQAPALVVGGLK